MHSIWFWVKEPSGVGRDVTFNVARDNVYLAIMLLGMGGATVLVLAYTMISQVVGKFTVRLMYFFELLCTIHVYTVEPLIKDTPEMRTNLEKQDTIRETAHTWINRHSRINSTHYDIQTNTVG